MMVEITLDTKLDDLLTKPGLQKIRDYVIYSPMGYHRHMYGQTIGELSKIGWNADSMIYGLRRLLEASEDSRFYAPVYGTHESMDDPKKKDVNVLFFPSKIRTNKPYVIIAAGGGYSGVCSIVEGYPVAARFNELGFDSFVFTYRVGGKGILPKPLEDLAAAVRYINAHADYYGLKNTHYAVAGFSAGGNLTALFGLEEHGYEKFGVSRPTALVPVYPVINMNTFSVKTDGDQAPYADKNHGDQSSYADKNHTNRESCSEKNHANREFCEIMYGENFTEEDVLSHNIDEQATHNYPPSYILCCKDDPIVPFMNGVLLKNRLDSLGIPAALELCETGGHGFGEGRGTQAEGWIARAAAFIDSIS